MRTEDLYMSREKGKKDLNMERMIARQSLMAERCIILIFSLISGNFPTEKGQNTAGLFTFCTRRVTTLIILSPHVLKIHALFRAVAPFTRLRRRQKTVHSLPAGPEKVMKENHCIDFEINKTRSHICRIHYYVGQ